MPVLEPPPHVHVSDAGALAVTRFAVVLHLADSPILAVVPYPHLW